MNYDIKKNIKKYIVGSKYDGILRWIYRHYMTLYNVKLLPSMATREKILFVFLDYEVFPYDFSSWVLVQNLHFEMERLGCARFDLIIVNDVARRRCDQEYISDDYTFALIQSMVIDGLVMIPKLRNVYYFKNKLQALIFYIRNFYRNIFPNNYNALYPDTDRVHYAKYTQEQLLGHERKITYFKPHEASVFHVTKWCAMNNLLNENIVTVTVRNTRIEYRNSKIDEWAKAVNYLSNEYNISFVVIPDYNDIYNLNDYESFSGLAIICNEAAASIRFRMALYSRAILNMSVECGVDVFAMYLENPFITFKKIVDDDNMKLNNGLQYGKSWVHFTDLQKIIWEDDLSENIIAEAVNMLSAIDHSLTRD